MATTTIITCRDKVRSPHPSTQTNRASCRITSKIQNLKFRKVPQEAAREAIRTTLPIRTLTFILAWCHHIRATTTFRCQRQWWALKEAEANIQCQWLKDSKAFCQVILWWEAAGQCTRQTRSFETHTTTHRPRALISSCTQVICIRECHVQRVLIRWAHSTIACTKGKEAKVDNHLRCIPRSSQASTRVEDQITTHLLLCEDHPSQILVNPVMGTRKCLANTLTGSASRTIRTEEKEIQVRLTKIADNRQRLALLSPV